MRQSILAFLCVGQLLTLHAETSTLFKMDLRKIGYQVSGLHAGIADYTDLVFLSDTFSDTLLLVSINELRMGDLAKNPDNKLVLIDLTLGRAAGELRMTAEQSPGSVQALSGARFAVLSGPDLRIFNRDLTCQFARKARGPLQASPLG